MQAVGKTVLPEVIEPRQRLAERQNAVDDAVNVAEIYTSGS